MIYKKNHIQLVFHVRVCLSVFGLPELSAFHGQVYLKKKKIGKKLILYARTPKVFEIFN